MKYSKYDIEHIKDALNRNEARNPLMYEARRAIIQLEEENALLKKQIDAAGLTRKCGTCPKFINRLNNVGQCKILSNKVVKADQECLCPKLRRD